MKKSPTVFLALVFSWLVAGCIPGDTMSAASHMATALSRPTTTLPALDPGMSSATATERSDESSSVASADNGSAPALTAKEIYRQLAPAAAYIVTPTGTGSGILLEGGYIVTNAHVIWPFHAVRVVFANGDSFDDVPVINTDFMVDLAVLGPVRTDFPPATLSDGEKLPIGEDVYLIGYPAEGEPSPQPAISRGLISRMREWGSEQLSYFQSDAAITGGQSGGMLVGPDGSVIGISGFSLGDTFALAASAGDLLTRIEELIAGEDTDGLTDRNLLESGTVRHFTVIPDHFWDNQMFIFYDPETESSIDATGFSEGIIFLDVSDIDGYFVVLSDNSEAENAAASFTPQLPAPYFMVTGLYDEPVERIQIDASRRFAPFDDPDDGHSIAIDMQVAAMIDYPGDLDHFVLTLSAGDTVEITVESVAIDPFLQIDDDTTTYEVAVDDDNSGGGIFGTAAMARFTATSDDPVVVTVEDAASEAIGGYLLRVTRIK